MAERGCGHEVPGGCYWKLDLAPFGHPVEEFCKDPGAIIETEDMRLAGTAGGQGMFGPAMGLTQRGVRVFQDTRDGRNVHHVVDWVGSKYYPNVADFLEEVRSLGLSRRLELSAADYSKLTYESRLLVVHSRALVLNFGAYWAQEAHACTAMCPHNVGRIHCGRIGVLHGRSDALLTEACSRIWWEDIEGGGPVDSAAIRAEYAAVAPEMDARLVQRRLPSVRYLAWARPAGLIPAYAVGIFAAFPLGHLAVVDDPEGQRHLQAIERLQEVHASVPVILEDGQGKRVEA